MKREENRVESTMRSAEHIKRVSVSDDLMERLHSIPAIVKASYDKVPKKVLWGVAASIAVLVILNLISLKQYSEKTTDSVNQETELYFDYLNQL